MKKNIVFIIPSFRRGGVEKVTLNILNSINTERYDLTLIICYSGSNSMTDSLQSNVNIIELNKKNVRKALPNIFKSIKKISPNIVFTSFNHLSLAVLIYKSLFNARFKTIIRMNTLPSNKLGANFRGKLYEILFSKVIKNADSIITQTDEMRKDTISFYKLDSDKVITIRNLVDVKGIKDMAICKKVQAIKEEGVHTLISIGSLGRVKGFDLLIKAIHNLVLKGNSIKLYIIGDNRESNENYKAVLEDLIIRYNLNNHVVLLGFKKNPYPYLKQADSFVLSSRKEGFPNVVLEALVLNKPCLVTNCINFSGIIKENENGIIVEKEKIEALEEGILKIQSIKFTADLKINNFDYNDWFKTI